MDEEESVTDTMIAIENKFDIYLKQKDERFGLRNIQTDLQPLAKQNGFLLEHKIEMPNGNVSNFHFLSV